MAENGATCDFESDPRTPCKYGSICYRKNQSHLEQYKHPSNVEEKIVATLEQPKKKLKPNGFEPESSKSPSKHDKPAHSIPPKEALNVEPIKKHESPSTLSVPVKDRIRSSDSKKVLLSTDERTLIKNLFLVSMPNDFYSFWLMCKTLNKDNTLDALKDIKLKLVGPYDVLAGRVTEVYEEDVPDFLKHWRYYYDPPEFQTVLSCNDARCYHLGYYRDDPKEEPVFVASNATNSKNPEKNGEIKIMGPNLFAALHSYLEELEMDPFSRMKARKFQKILKSWAIDNGFTLEKSSKQMELRSRKVVSKTFHSAGIVVPVDKKNDVGYRELAASNAMIKRILKGIVESKCEEDRKSFWEQLQPVITFANIANDECDFGTALELGLDLFTYGSPLLHRTAKQLLTTAYELLGRSEYAKIIEVHLEDRKKGNKLSIL